MFRDSLRRIGSTHPELIPAPRPFEPIYRCDPPRSIGTDCLFKIQSEQITDQWRWTFFGLVCRENMEVIAAAR